MGGQAPSRPIRGTKESSGKSARAAGPVTVAVVALADDEHSLPAGRVARQTDGLDFVVERDGRRRTRCRSQFMMSGDVVRGLETWRTTDGIGVKALSESNGKFLVPHDRSVANDFEHAAGAGDVSMLAGQGLLAAALACLSSALMTPSCQQHRVPRRVAGWRPSR